MANVIGITNSTGFTTTITTGSTTGFSSTNKYLVVLHHSITTWILSI